MYVHDRVLKRQSNCWYHVPFCSSPSHSQLLGISAIILANLCVSYIMTSHTEEV